MNTIIVSLCSSHNITRHAMIWFYSYDIPHNGIDFYRACREQKTYQHVGELWCLYELTGPKRSYLPPYILWPFILLLRTANSHADRVRWIAHLPHPKRSNWVGQCGLGRTQEWALRTFLAQANEIITTNGELINDEDDLIRVHCDNRLYYVYDFLTGIYYTKIILAQGLDLAN